MVLNTTITHKDKTIQGLIARNETTQMKVYDQYYTAMYNTAFRIVNDKWEAEDIMQESFLAAFAAIDSFSGKVTFGAWLKRIVINKSIAAYNKNKKAPMRSLETKDYFSEDISIEEDTKTNEVNSLLNNIQKLKENYRLAITLHYIEGYDYEEIAEIMLLKYDNIRAIMSRAKKKLKELVQKEKIV